MYERTGIKYVDLSGIYSHVQNLYQPIYEKHAREFFSPLFNSLTCFRRGSSLEIYNPAAISKKCFNLFTLSKIHEQV